MQLFVISSDEKRTLRAALNYRVDESNIENKRKQLQVWACLFYFNRLKLNCVRKVIRNTV